MSILLKYAMTIVYLMRYQTQCGNCGTIGHHQRACPSPRTSYGILLISSDGCPLPKVGDPESLESRLQILSYCRQHLGFCLVSRRISLGLVEIVLGHYEPTDIAGLRDLFRQLYPSERPLIASANYRRLLSHFLNYRPAAELRHGQLYRRAEIKFNALVQSRYHGLDYYLRTVDCQYHSPEWGIPKGRRSRPTESDLAVARREFEEETGHRCYQVLETCPLIEEMTGTNGVKYRHVYYLALDGGVPPCQQRADPVEIGETVHCTYDQAMSLLRPYHQEKRQVLTQAFLYTCQMVSDEIRRQAVVGG